MTNNELIHVANIEEVSEDKNFTENTPSSKIDKPASQFSNTSNFDHEIVNFEIKFPKGNFSTDAAHPISTLDQSYSTVLSEKYFQTLTSRFKCYSGDLSFVKAIVLLLFSVEEAQEASVDLIYGHNCKSPPKLVQHAFLGERESPINPFDFPFETLNEACLNAIFLWIIACGTIFKNPKRYGARFCLMYRIFGINIIMFDFKHFQNDHNSITIEKEATFLVTSRWEFWYARLWLIWYLLGLCGLTVASLHTLNLVFWGSILYLLAVCNLIGLC